MECVALKKGIEVELFDNNSTSNSYLLSYKGRHWRVSPFVVCVYEALTKVDNVDDAYKLISDASKINVPVEKVEEVVGFFKNNGLFEGTDDVDKVKKTKDLWGKITIIPAKVVNKFSWLSTLFDKNVMAVVAAGEIVCFTYFFITYDSQTIISDLWKLNTWELLICILAIMLFGLIHEFGHSVALISKGQKAGAIGMGVYLYMPVFYSNVTNAWKLKRMQRVCVDVGGIYFQALGISIIYLLTNLIDSGSFIKCSIIISALQIIGNFNPFIKMDGYWIICDLLGVSNPYSIIVEGIKNIFTKGKKKTEFVDMKLGVKCTFFVYAVLIMVYFTYLIGLMVMLFANALRQIVEDISNIGLISDMDISFSDVTSFMKTRVTLYLVLFFMIRLIFMLFKKLFVIRNKVGRNN